MLCSSPALLRFYERGSQQASSVCWLAEHICPKLTVCFLVSLTMRWIGEWKQERWTSSIRFSFTSQFLHRILRFPQVKREVLWRTVAAGVQQQALAPTPPSSLLPTPLLPTSQDLWPLPGRFLCLASQTTWLGDLYLLLFINNLIAPWLFSRQ